MTTAQQEPTGNRNVDPRDVDILAIDLLGGLRIRICPHAPGSEPKRQEIAVPGGKAQQLLAYLLLHPRVVHPRETLAELLWPAMPPARSRRNLSDTLYRLRQLVPRDDWLEVDANGIGLRKAAPLTVDVWEFQRAAACDTPQDLARAVACYRAPLLPDLYDDWLAPHRRALQEEYLAVLLRLAEHQEQHDELDTAHQTLLRAIQTEPLLEPAYRALMRVLAKLNRVPDALNAYEQLVDLLEHDVAAPPAPATRELADALFRELELARQGAQKDDLWRPRFVGRRRERSGMLAAIEGAIGGQGCVLAVDGPAGIGKTRLLEELETSARWRGAMVIWGRAGEQPSASPLEPLADAVRAALAGPRAAQIETLLDRETLAVLGPLYTPWADLDTPADLPPEQAQQRFLNRVNTLFATLAELNPLVLILDDLHWADPTLWFLLDGLVARCREMPLAVLCSYRRLEVEAGPGWAYLQNWERENRAQIYALAALDEKEVNDLLGPERMDRFEDVWAGSGGNPFYVVQALAALSEGVAPHARTTGARLAELDEAGRATLETAAVLGRTVSYSLLSAAVSLSPRALIRAGDELTARHFFEPIESGYRFTHDLIQEAAYNAIEPARRQALHSRMAEILAERQPDNLRSRAYHLEQGARLGAAGELYAEVARQDIARFAYAEARAALIKAVDYLPLDSSPQRVELLLELARLSNLGGDVERATACLHDALAGAQASGRGDLQTEIRVQMADLAALTGAHEAADADFEAAWELAQAQSDPALQLSVLLPWADFQVRVSRFEAARYTFERAIELAQAAGDRDGEGRALEGMGWVLAGLGEPAATVVDYMERALVAHVAGGNQFEEARTRVNLFSCLQNAGVWDRLFELETPMLDAVRRVGYRRGEASAQQAICWMHLALGDLDAARAAGEQAQALFEECGDTMGASLAISALGTILLQQGEMDAAQQYMEQALGIVKELGSDVFEAYAHHELGVLFLLQGQHAQAEAELAQATTCWERSGDPLNLFRSQTRLAQVYLAQDKPTQAGELAQGAWDYLQQGMPQSNFTLEWLMSLYALLQGLGRVEQAQWISEQAYKELLRQAAQIVDVDVRRRFLEYVAVNQSVTAAYDAEFGVERGYTVRLARRAAPLGRALQPMETVEVAWTRHAPEDEAISDRTARRRHVLQRLHREAQAQHALPTDDDFAQALDVSRRTILRDIQALAEAGIVIATRSRPNKT